MSFFEKYFVFCQTNNTFVKNNTTMALILNTQIIPVSNAAIRIYDTTGTYNAINPGGWGAPNPLMTSPTSATISITSDVYTTPQIYTIDLSVLTYDLTDIALPGGLLLTATAALGEATWPDGFYKFELIIITGGVTYRYTNYQGFYYDVECCVRSQAMSLTLPVNNAAQIYQNAFMAFLLDSLGYAACCGNEDQYLNILDYLESLCEDCGRYTAGGTVTVPCGCH